MDLPILDISYKWSHTLWGLLCLIFSPQHCVFKFHSCYNMYQYFIPFSGPNNIPWYGYTTFCSPIRQLRLFLPFGYKKIILLWTFVRKYLCEHIFNSLGYITKSRTAGSHDHSMLNFEKLPNCFPFSIPLSSMWEFQFLHILTNTCYCPSFWL